MHIADGLNCDGFSCHCSLSPFPSSKTSAVVHAFCILSVLPTYNNFSEMIDYWLYCGNKPCEKYDDIIDAIDAGKVLYNMLRAVQLPVLNNIAAA